MEQKIRGLLAYLFGWVGGLIVLLAFQDNNEQTKFNACQSIVISACGMLISLAICFIPYVGLIAYAVNIFVIVLAIIGMIRAYNEQDYELPVISDLTRNIFKSTLNK